MARIFAAALLVFTIVASVAQAHEIAGCSFPANVSSQANLTVAGAALTALDGSDVFGSHDTVFLPTDAAFAALLKKLGLTEATDLLTPELRNTTIAILAYHALPHKNYTVAQLVGNKTLQTNLGELESEISGRNVSRNLTFAIATGGSVQTFAAGTGDRVRITSTNTTATTLESEPTKLCGRTVYTIDAVLIPTDKGVADIPTNIPAAIQARLDAEEAEEAAAPSQATATQAASRTLGSALPLAAIAVAGSSLLLHAL